jgi:Tetratricopeptide repeat.
MTSKSEIAIWTAAGELFFENQPMEAIEAFSQINSYSKVLFNLGMIYSFMGDYENADSMFEKSLRKDQFFAAAYFQKGLALFELHEYDLAIRCYRFSLKVSRTILCMK